ncbi:MAG: DEAD/DEAH box helicase [Candidatus Heimdallarchaeota archaeon]
MNDIKFIVHSQIKPETIEARVYQQTILASCAKENTLVVLPTGLGKTTIMLLIALLRLKKNAQGFVIILAPSKPLVEQHKETFQRILTDPEMVQSLTGEIVPKNRQAIWKKAKIVIATPQIVQNDIISGIVRLEKCISLEIDEAHKTRGNYAYVFVAKTYLKQAENPLISAFTASPGTSFEEIKSLCDILDIKNIESRTEKDPDVQPYVQPVEVELIRVKLSKEFQNLQNLLKQCIADQLKLLEESGFRLSLTKLRKKDVLEVQKKIQQKIQDGVQPSSFHFEALGAASNTIRLLHGKELLETQGIKAFSGYLNNLTKRKQTQALRNLIDNTSFKKTLYYTEKLAEREHLHPKFRKVKEIIVRQFVRNPNSRILIFSRFRITLKLLNQELIGDSTVKSHIFIGQKSKDQDRGMTQEEQYSTLKAFRDGIINVLLATNIGEEGIDITTCDLVIFFDAVSPIRTIQRRGRTGRKFPGRVVVLVTQGTQEEGIYWISKRKEKEMYKMMKLVEDYSKQLKIERTQRTLDKFVEKDISIEEHKDKGIIVVDRRETNSAVVKQLYNLGFNTKLKQLLVGDYVIGDVAIERKTTEDFVQSIFDGRLFREAKNMAGMYDRGVLIIEGEKPFTSHRAIDQKALKGAIASLFIDFKLTILPSRGPEETADLIAAIARRVLSPKTQIPRITTEKVPIALPERQKRIIAAFPNVNSVLATRLLHELKTPKNILLASKEELQMVKGVGPSIAAIIREIVDSKYSE